MLCTQRRRRSILRRLALLLIAAALLAPSAANARSYTVRATVYSGACDGQGSLFADGNTLASADSGKIDNHIVASSWLPMHARIKFDHKVFGRRNWTVRDRGGYFDLYRPNCAFGSWNNPRLHFQVITK